MNGEEMNNRQDKDDPSQDKDAPSQEKDDPSHRRGKSEPTGHKTTSITDHSFENLKRKKRPSSGIPGYDTPKVSGYYTSTAFPNRSYPRVSGASLALHESYTNGAMLASLKQPPPSPAAAGVERAEAAETPKFCSADFAEAASPASGATATGGPLGKPSKKNSLEDDVPTERELKFTESITKPGAFAAMGVRPMEVKKLSSDASRVGASYQFADARLSKKMEALSIPSAKSQPGLKSPDGPRSTTPIAERKSSVRFDLPEHPHASPKTSAAIEDDKVLQAAILASQREQQPVAMAEECARTLWDVASEDPVNTELVQDMLNEARRLMNRIEQCIDAAANTGGDLGLLLAVNDRLTYSINTAERAISSQPKPPPPPPDGIIKKPSHGILYLMDKKDIFTIICTLRASEYNRRVDGALAILIFSRGAEVNGQEERRVCNEIRSSGGMQSLLAMFRARNTVYELRVVASLAVAYMLPCFVESTSDLPPTMSLKFIECLRFLAAVDRDVSPNGQYLSEQISPAECFRAANAALGTFWISSLEPKLGSQISRDMVGVEGVASTRDSFSLRRVRLVSRNKMGAVFDQRHETIALRELLEVTVSLIVFVAKRSDSPSIMALVEQVCAIDVARPIAVREGILQTLVQWLKKSDGREATLAMCYLTSIKDKYMAGWIHSEIVNKGAVGALADLAYRPSVSRDVRLAVAKILASLCAAPHTRAAVVEANCIGFLITFLYDDSPEPSSEEVMMFSGSALVQLAAGSITRAVVLSGGDTDMGDAVSPDKRDALIDDIVEQGAIARFVAIARDRVGNLRSVAVEALRVLSEDVSPARQTRLRLCEAGAVEALGKTLQHDMCRVPDDLPLDLAFESLKGEKMKNLSQALSALANILDPVRSPVTSFERNTSTASHVFQDLDSIRIRGCLDTARSGGLESLLKISFLPFTTGDETDRPRGVPWAINLVEESCRSLASITPFFVKEKVAEAGYSYGAHGVLNGFYEVLKQLVSTFDVEKDADPQDVDEQMNDLVEIVLQGLGSLAKTEPLKTHVIDKILPYLMRLVGGRDTPGTANTVREALQSLDVAADDIVVQVAGNNAHLFAEWFCLRRSLLIQAMARTEIRQVVLNTWETPFSESEISKHMKLIREPSSTFGDDDGEKHSMALFGSFADDESTAERRDRLSQQYYDVYGRQSLLGGSAEGVWACGHEPGLLYNQMYPLNSSSAEKEWVLQHREFQEDATSRSSGSLSKHVDTLLTNCFPSKLLRERVVPYRTLCPEASFDFRAIMMPQRRYFSFSREGKLVARICDGEASKSSQPDIHWTLGFTDSAFAGEFAESLVQLLYLYPMIRGLSFSRTGDVNDEAQDCEDNTSGGEILASLVGSLPASVSHLTFDGILNEDDLCVLVRLLETMGKLTVVQGDSATTAQGKFSFLAIRRTPNISTKGWLSLFNLLGDSHLFVSAWPGPNSGLKKPLTWLKSLDLSFNNLGDELSASVLRIALNDECSRYLEDLDLSGNDIRRGSEVVNVLRRAADSFDRKRRSKASLQTLRLASNGLGPGYAWLDILSAIQNEAFGIRALDLSTNEISLGDVQHSEKEFFIRMLLSNTDLENLDLSSNSLSSSAVDDVIRELSNIVGSDCGLGFLLLENNDPKLTSDQFERLEAFSFSSRRVLLNKLGRRRVNESEPPEPSPPEPSPPDIIYPDPLLAEPPETDNLITVMFSAPLVFHDHTNQLKTFPKLNLDMERELIWQCLKEASRDIDLSYDNATSDRLLAAMTRRCTCLHYSGHGHHDYLPFEENGTGYPKWFPVEEFRSLIEHQGSAPFRFVFVSACHSELAGKTFASAGVPHVVCCQQEDELKDVAALAFTKQFYLALAMGRTVKDSFEQGRRAVRHSALRNAEAEMRKFMLLPENGNHDVPIFRAEKVREWPRFISRRGSVGPHANKSSELAVRNLIQEDPAPAPPEFFVGREIEMHKVLQAVWTRRLVSVVGESGIGRSSLVAAVCHYINERRNTVAEKIERIYHVKAKHNRKRDRYLVLVLQLLKRLVQEGKAQMVDDEEDAESINEAIYNALRNVKALVVFDHVDILEDAEEWNKFPMMIQELLRETPNIRILITNREPLGIPKLQEYPIPLGSLTLRNTIKLFGHVCPFIHTPGQRRQLMLSLLPNSDDELDREGDLLYSEDLEQPAKKIFEMIGEGIPARIENAAYLIDKVKDLTLLLDGRIREAEVEKE